MRGGEERQAGFIVMTTLEDVVPDDHPLRAIRALVDRALEEMSPELEALYAAGGRPSIAPEYLLRAQLAEMVTDGRCRFTVSHATRFAASLAPPIITRMPRAAGRGDTVTIVGKGFGKRRGRSVVRFGSAKCATYAKWSATRITCRVPATAKVGRLKVKVTTAAGTSSLRPFLVLR